MDAAAGAGAGCGCADAVCGVTAQQHIGVELPISLLPFTRLGPVRAACCGAPSVLACQVYRTTGGVSCTLRVEQTIRLDIPIAFGAELCPGEPDVQLCGEPERFPNGGAVR